MLEGHEELVRCIRFDSKRIVSGAYDGKIKVWDLVAALDPRAQSNSLCLNTLVVSFDIFKQSNFQVMIKNYNFCLRNTLVAFFVCNLMNFKLSAVLTMIQY